MKLSTRSTDTEPGAGTNAPANAGTTSGTVADNNPVNTGGAKGNLADSTKPADPPKEITRGTVRDKFQVEGIYANDELIDEMLRKLWEALSGDELFRTYRRHRSKKRTANS